jgi:hypothetical protein
MVAFGILNVVTYACLLPLWEGFDEPFHYGYVQHLATSKRLPIAGEARLSMEIWNSLHLAPGSRAVQWNMPFVITYEEFYRKDVHAQRAQIAELRALPKRRSESSEFANYQAHHPPLSYAVLAIVDAATSSIAIVPRVMILRIVAGVASVLMMSWAAVGLAAELDLGCRWRNMLLLCVFCSQMFYASVAHVSNDWLALPLLPIWVIAACRFLRGSGLRAGMPLGIATTLGLLTKAYFLAMLPLLLLLLVWKFVRDRSTMPLLTCLACVVPALPWYARNVALYGNVPGTAEATSGITTARVVAAAPKVDWASSAMYMARASVWTGNNSFTNFSVRVLNTYLVMLGGLVALSLCHSPAKLGLAYVITWSAILLFSAAIAYATVASFVMTHGRSPGASPWYMQTLLLPVFAVALHGAKAAGRIGQYLAAAFCAMGVYLLIATYLVKLVPLYTGYPYGKTTLLMVIEWYGKMMEGPVVGVGMVPIPAVLCLAAAAILAGIILGVQTVSALVADERRRRTLLSEAEG